jgi:hypothetical protein
MNLEKIKEIYGEEILQALIDNKEEVQKNIYYMLRLDFDDTEDIFERVTPLFITDSKTFKNKIDGLIKKLGPDYVNIIESDLGLLEELL